MSTRPTTRTLGASALFALLALVASPVHAAAPSGEPNTARQLAEVRRATAGYHDVTAAEAAGYAQISPCVPQMGFHYMRGGPSHAGDPLDHAEPEMLVYAPRPNGSLRLVAVEYAYAAGEDEPTPTLFGRKFDAPHPAGGPPFHTLHVWVWQGNPDGTFTPTNRNVSCD